MEATMFDTTRSPWITFIDGNARARLSADGRTVTHAEYEGRTVTPKELGDAFCRTEPELVILVTAYTGVIAWSEV